MLLLEWRHETVSQALLGLFFPAPNAFNHRETRHPRVWLVVKVITIAKARGDVFVCSPMDAERIRILRIIYFSRRIVVRKACCSV